VDALCIIQDPKDPSDWERESHTVGQVYRDAYFTICASSTSSCHQSFLDRHQHTFDIEFRSSLSLPTESTYTLLFAGLTKVNLFRSILKSANLINSVWEDRGWVFQERHLSPRKLVFGEYMVEVECGSIRMSETGETQMDCNNWSAAAVATLSKEEVYDEFMEVVKDQSPRRFTYESDRLPALSGVVQVFSGIVRDKYLAGLWKEDLYRGLLWHGQAVRDSLLERMDALRASAGSAAPSWSYVSQPGYFEHGLPGWQIPHYASHQRPEYSDMDGWTVLSGAQLNPFGSVKSGTIRIRGKVLPVPAELVLVPQDLFLHGIWKVHQDGAGVAYCTLDWTNKSPRQGPGMLEMLLLSSSRASQTPRRGFFYPGEGIRDLSEESGEDENSHEEEDCDERESDGEGDSEEDGGQHLPNPRNPCTANEHLRDLWGLIIHPAENDGEYFRVGVFVSRPGKVGGTHLFQNVEERTIDII
jgi:hypothetical protein